MDVAHRDERQTLIPRDGEREEGRKGRKEMRMMLESAIETMNERHLSLNLRVTSLVSWSPRSTRRREVVPSTISSLRGGRRGSE